MRSSARLLAACSFLLLFLPASALAQTPYLVDDINETADVAGSTPHSFVQVGTQIFFVALARSEGYQLWKTDDTGAGTAAVTSDYFSSISSLTSSNGKLFFMGGNATHYGLWVSDGTASGTQMLKAIDNISLLSSSGPSTPVDVNGTLFFTADNGAGGRSLWKSDGTPSGTVIVKSVLNDARSVPVWLTPVNGTLFFVTGDSAGSLPVADFGAGWNLWKSDGTEAGTASVKYIYPGPANASPSNLLNVNGTLFFTGYDGAINGGIALWKSDGTEAGTCR